MNVVVTGADRPIGALLCRGLSGPHEVRGVGWEVSADPGLGELPYQRLDLRIPFAARAALEGVDAIVHAMPYDPPMPEGDDAEQIMLDHVARGTYVLINAASEARIGRLILISHMSLMEDYPADFAVREDWIPQPRANGAGLAPYLAELVGREIARIGRLEVVCLRLGELDSPTGTSGADAVRAVEKSLWQDSPGGGYCWSLRHVVTGGRFARTG